MGINDFTDPMMDKVCIDLTQMGYISRPEATELTYKGIQEMHRWVNGRKSILDEWSTFTILHFKYLLALEFLPLMMFEKQDLQLPASSIMCENDDLANHLPTARKIRVFIKQVIRKHFKTTGV